MAPADGPDAGRTLVGVQAAAFEGVDEDVSGFLSGCGVYVKVRRGAAVPRRTEPKRVSELKAERTGFDRFPYHRQKCLPLSSTNRFSSNQLYNRCKNEQDNHTQGSH